MTVKEKKQSWIYGKEENGRNGDETNNVNGQKRKGMRVKADD